MPTQNDDSSRPMTSLEKLSRRAFLARAGAAGVVTATASVAAPKASATSAEQQPSPPEAAIPGTVPITLRVNGETYSLQIDSRATLLDTLRETMYLTGTKKGCDHGQCGHRRSRHTRQDARRTGRVRRTRQLPVRLLHQRPDHVRRRNAA